MVQDMYILESCEINNGDINPRLIFDNQFVCEDDGRNLNLRGKYMPYVSKICNAILEYSCFPKECNMCAQYSKQINNAILPRFKKSGL